MKLTNYWVGYLDRTYQTIKESILNRLRTSVPELTDLNESNLFVILVSIFSGISEQLNYYIDLNARESYLGTARRFSSVVKLVRILDYRIKAALPASVNLYFTYTDNAGNPVYITEPAIIPEGTAVTTSSGMQFLTTQTVQVPIGGSYGMVPAKQWSKVAALDLGTTTTGPNQEFPIPGPYAHNSIQITIDGVPWTRVDTLALSLPDDKHFIVEIGEDSIPRVTFGNGINGEIPNDGESVIADYYITQGAQGNLISRGLINQLQTVLVLPDPATAIMVRNNLPPTAGANLEDIESIRFNAPLTTKSVERAVTAEDFNYLSQKAPGVGKASVVYQCGPDIDVYISPVGGGIASDILLLETKDYLDDVRLLNTHLRVLPAGETPIVVELNVTPRFRVNTTDLTQEIIATLLTNFSYNNVQINGRVAVSDIIAAIDNLSRVDTVDLINLSTMPYAAPVGHTDQLDWTRETQPGSRVRTEWRLVNEGTTFRVFRDNSFIGNAAVNVTYTDPDNIISFRVNPGGMYTPGQMWDFVTYPFNSTIRLDDNTLPVVTQSTINISIV